MALEVTHRRVVGTYTITGRTDHDLLSDIRQIRPRVRGATNSYLFDHRHVGSIFRRVSTGELYVCRSVLQQFYFTGWASNATLIKKSGSSTTGLIECFSEYPIIENEHVRDFWKEFYLVTPGDSVKQCIYCGALVDEDDRDYFQCGTHRSYYKHKPSCTSECNIFGGKHSSVHDSIFTEDEQ